MLIVLQLLVGATTDRTGYSRVECTTLIKQIVEVCFKHHVSGQGPTPPRFVNVRLYVGRVG